MSKYTIGNKVIKADSEGHGTIIEVMPPRRGRQLYKVSWGSIVTDELEMNLLPDCDISDPFERCMSGIFGSYSEYSKKNTTFKIRSSNNNTISSLKASKTLFRAYQFKPLLKFLNSPNRRLLVADEVGLGKTIEAGHIMLELKARRELNHVLIVCPKSLQRKWKDELAFKFGLQFKIYESQKDLLADMQEHRVAVHAIINYEKIRMKRQKSKDEKKAKDEMPKNIVEFLSQNDFHFSLVLCDEAHKMRNRETQTYKGAEIIMSQANAAVFLTATPVMISTENLYNLLHLLDNTRYYNYQIFDNRLQENRPFVDALTDLNHHVPLPVIAKNLNEAEILTRFFSDEVEIFSHQTTVGKAFADDAMYQEIIQMLNGEDNTKNRARLQYLISSMSMMNNIFSRTRKREVTTDMSLAERKPHMRKVVLTEEERIEFDRVIEEYKDDNSYTDYWGEEVLTQGGALGLVQKKRQVASSVYAYLNTESNLDKGIDEYADYTDAKFEELLRIIDEVFRHGTKKIVIFALFRKTLKYLQIRFKQRGFGTLMIHGMVENRIDILDEFKNNPKAHILLSSEVGSEGLDMQFCNSMVNYDLPWNPMVVEQRIGRIDRFGQKSPTVNIYNVIVADSIQEDIYIRLLDRIGIFRGTIGDMEAILDAPLERGGSVTIQDVYNKLEKELYTSRLTEDEKRRKIAEIELAIANEKESIKHLEEGLDNALTNDAYFKDEINRIQNNNAYVTEIELRNYLESAIRQELTTCSLVKVEKDIYELQLPLSNPRILLNFLTQNQPDGEENATMFRQFRNEIEDKQAIRMTFNQQVAYDNNKLLFMNIYNPIIQACLNYFCKHDNESKTSFCYALSSDDVLKKGTAYYMVVYQMSITRKVLGVPKRTDTLLPLLYSVDEQRVITEETMIDRIFSRSQTEGTEHNASNKDIEPEMLQDMRYDFAEEVNEQKATRMAEIRLQVESDRQRNEKQTNEYYASMIDNLRRFVRGWESDIEMLFDVDEKRVQQLQGAIRLAQARIQQMEKEKEDRLTQIRESSQIEIGENIVSLNLINII
ncbi:SNF2-related protein [Prevotella histicola]|uniref:DEAD/DEAH box helicase n=1 Tax=Prevotella histicola TaxID=470565 RepID=UPI0028E67852|nr:SNF2-related protein [Prevotella histicola]